MREIEVHTTCDVDACHATADGHTVRIDTDPTRLIDLCADHTTALLDPLAKLLAAHGVDPASAAPTPRPAPRFKGRAPSDPNARPLWCPSCGASPGTSKSAMSAHGRTAHGRTLTQLYYPDGAPYRCPLCSYTTSTGQGLSHHATYAHRDDAEPVGGIIGLHEAAARL